MTNFTAPGRHCRKTGHHAFSLLIAFAMLALLASCGGSDSDTVDEAVAIGCDPFVWPPVPATAEIVTAQLMSGGVTYQSITIPRAVYDGNAVGNSYDPTVIGGTHSISLLAVEAGGGRVHWSIFQFECPGTLDPTAGGLF